MFELDKKYRILQSNIATALNNGLYEFYQVLFSLKRDNYNLKDKLEKEIKVSKDLQRYVNILKAHIQKMDEQNRIAKIKKYK